ncbi:MAG TPA: hypothetical protein VKG38_04210 [Solirubrobacteraceae bacterium]|nr:hypothetical protein [Solirubrobacteraceae bacterium]
MTDEDKQVRTAQIVAVVALLVAVGACVVAIVALNKKPATPTVNPAVATGAVRALRSEAATLKSEAAALKSEVATLHTLVATADATLVKVTTCVPELTGQINGMSVETAQTGGYLTSAFLHQGKQISTYCTSTLEPSSPPR